MSAASPSYRQVAQNDDPAAPSLPSSNGRTRPERLEDKAVAFGWVILACIVAKYTNIFPIIFLWNNDDNDDNANTNDTQYADAFSSTAAIAATAADNEYGNQKQLRPNKVLLQIALVGFVIFIGIFLYLTVYLSKVKGLPSNDTSVWNIYCPRVLPIMGITFIMSYFILNRAIWPIFGFFSPLITGTQLMGAMMITQFIPTFGIC